jgi:hypothetical protein
MNITEKQFLAVLGYMTLMIQQRQTLDHTKSQCAAFLKGLGAKDEARMEVRDWVSEAVYNQGDDPESSARGVLSALKIEVI